MLRSSSWSHCWAWSPVSFAASKQRPCNVRRRVGQGRARARARLRDIDETVQSRSHFVGLDRQMIYPQPRLCKQADARASGLGPGTSFCLEFCHDSIAVRLSPLYTVWRTMIFSNGVQHHASWLSSAVRRGCFLLPCDVLSISPVCSTPRGPRSGVVSRRAVQRSPCHPFLLFSFIVAVCTPPRTYNAPAARCRPCLCGPCRLTDLAVRAVDSHPQAHPVLADGHSQSNATLHGRGVGRPVRA